METTPASQDSVNAPQLLWRKSKTTQKQSLEADPIANYYGLTYEVILRQRSRLKQTNAERKRECWN